MGVVERVVDTDLNSCGILDADNNAYRDSPTGIIIPVKTSLRRVDLIGLWVA
jgi:hypothetical protein